MGAAACVFACGRAPKPSPPPQPPPPTHVEAQRIEFIDDDFPRALAEAKTKKRLLVVDAWAPWCHTCLSMREYVFRDPSLAAAVGDGFVGVAMDTEKKANSAFVAAHPVEAWPTIFVIRPEPEQTIVKWPGSATTQELVALLEEARGAGGAGAGEATVAFLRGERAAAE